MVKMSRGLDTPLPIMLRYVMRDDNMTELEAIERVTLRVSKTLKFDLKEHLIAEYGYDGGRMMNEWITDAIRNKLKRELDASQKAKVKTQKRKT